MRASLLLRGSKPDQIQRAVSDLQGVVQSSPRNFVARYDLGRALFAKGEFEQARLAFEDAIKQRPEDYLPPRMALAQLYFQKGEHAKTVQAADAALRGCRGTCPPC